MQHEGSAQDSHGRRHRLRESYAEGRGIRFHVRSAREVKTVVALVEAKLGAS